MSQNPVARDSCEPSKKIADAIDWTREKVEDMAKRGNVKKGKPPLPFGQYYLVKPVPKKGADSFVWETLSREEAEGKLSCLSKHGLTCLHSDTFKKVSPAWFQVLFQPCNNVHTVLCLPCCSMQSRTTSGVSFHPTLTVRRATCCQM